MSEVPPKPTLKRIKTGKWQRQWSVAKTGMKIGSSSAAQMVGSAFLTKEHRQQKNKQLLSEQSLFLAEELGKLKGSVVKIGQLMALYGEHILPEEVTLALRTLEEQTLALEWPVIEQTLRQNLGQHYDDFTIEKEALAAASLAQVHQALHKSSAETLCFKVQYPRISDAIDSDINSLVTLLKLVPSVNVTQAFHEWVDEMRALLHFEVDYQREALLTEKFHRRLAHHSVFKVPTIYSEFSTQTLLVNSYEQGVAVNHPSVAALSLTRRNRLAKAFLELFITEVFVWGELQTDPNFGNYRIQIDESGQHLDKIVLLDFGAVLSYEDDFLQPVKDMLLGAYHNDDHRIRQGAIALGIMQESFPATVHQDFAALCQLLIEPFVHQQREVPAHAVNAQGEYCWGRSRLPRRAGKHAANSAMSKHFIVPPKEFAFLSRKLLGVYSFIAALDAQFNPEGVLDEFC